MNPSHSILLIAIAGVFILHIWKGNTLLSVAAGTILYMIFIRCLP